MISMIELIEETKAVVTIFGIGFIQFTQIFQLSPSGSVPRDDRKGSNDFHSFLLNLHQRVVTNDFDCHFSCFAICILGSRPNNIGKHTLTGKAEHFVAILQSFTDMNA